MTEEHNQKTRSPFDHPDAEALLRETFNELVLESDRGAVIVGADIVDSQLKILFESLMPEHISNKKRKNILKYPGPLSSLSAKADIALSVSFIDLRIYRCIEALRSIRNNAAHSNESFRLIDNKVAVQRMFDLGSGVPVAINHWAVETIMKVTTSSVMKLKMPDGTDIFDDPSEFMNYLSENPDTLGELEEKYPRVEFALGLILLSAMIIDKRESVLAVRN